MFFCCGLVAVHAQKTVRKLVLADHVNAIQINTDNCFTVSVQTTLSNEVQVNAEIEGEYSRDLDLKTATNGNTLVLSAGFTPNFENPNDKLSAHKVVSIALYVTVPKGKRVDIYGTNSRVVATGTYSQLNVSLSDGDCNLTNVRGEVYAKTQSGTIYLSADKGKVSATSKYGQVSANPIPIGNSQILLETVTGNIELSKTE